MREHRTGTREGWQAARAELAQFEAEQAQRNEEIQGSGSSFRGSRCVCCGHAASPPGRCREGCPTAARRAARQCPSKRVTAAMPGARPSCACPAADLPAGCHTARRAYRGSIRAATAACTLRITADRF
jgi:hypothetical protein